MIDKIGFIIIALLLISPFMGLILKWHNEPNVNFKAYWSKWWHRIALAIRVCLWLSVWMLTANWILTLVVVIIDCIAYPIIINLINGWKWYYLGSTSKIDILIKKTIVWLKAKTKSLLTTMQGIFTSSTARKQVIQKILHKLNLHK